MANPNNDFRQFNLHCEFELNHEKGICEFRVDRMNGERLASMKYVQGMYFDKNNRLMSEEDVEAMKWLLRLLTEEK